MKYREAAKACRFRVAITISVLSPSKMRYNRLYFSYGNYTTLLFIVPCALIWCVYIQKKPQYSCDLICASYRKEVITLSVLPVPRHVVKIHIFCNCCSRLYGAWIKSLPRFKHKEGIEGARHRSLIKKGQKNIKSWLCVEQKKKVYSIWN